MLVYVQNLAFKGDGAKEAVLKGVGAWLKEQMGFGLHPDQLKTEGEHTGSRENPKTGTQTRSSLHIYAATGNEPELYAWVLKNGDDNVYGRRWTTELGVKCSGGLCVFSCVLRTDEQSTLIDSPVSASIPRVIRYVVSNIREAGDATFDASVIGINPKTVGLERDSYRALLAEIEHASRKHPIVLVSPTRDGDYPVDVNRLQQSLFGLAQVVRVSEDFNRFEMEEVLGQRWSAWNGAINVLAAPSQTGRVWSRYFLTDEINGWGSNQHEKLTRLLAWVTNSTNIHRLSDSIRAEGVMQLALRRRLQSARTNSANMNAADLKKEIEEATKLVQKQAELIKTLEGDNAAMGTRASELQQNVDDLQQEAKRRKYEITSLKSSLASAGNG